MENSLKREKRKYTPPTIAKFDLSSQKPFVTIACKNPEIEGEGGKPFCTDFVPGSECKDDLMGS